METTNAVTQPTDYPSMRAELERRRSDLEGFEAWLAREEAGGATVVRIETVRRLLGLPER